MRPLDGILVLDFSTLLPGPLATLVMAEAGAEVVKIEKPAGGDEMRGFAPVWGRDSVNFALLNRGKRSVAVDLKDPAGRERIMPLVRRADVIVEQFRPGVMERLGLDYGSVRAINPGIVYCSVTGFGQTGPKRDLAGHDLNYIADTGLLALSMGRPDAPVVPPALIADIAGGAYPAVINVLLALKNRERSGDGCHLDIAMSDNLFPFTFWAQGAGEVTGSWPGGSEDLLTGGTARYQLYGTRDGKVLAAAPIEQRFWNNFCDVIDLDPALRDDSADPDATLEAVRAIIAGDDAANWTGRFAGRDCCCNVVTGLREAFRDPHHRARGLFDHRVSGPAGEITAMPVPVSQLFRGEPEIAQPAPILGEHG